MNDVKTTVVINGDQITVYMDSKEFHKKVQTKMIAEEVGLTDVIKEGFVKYVDKEVEIDDENLYKLVKHKAIDDEKTIKEIINNILRRFVMEG